MIFDENSLVRVHPDLVSLAAVSLLLASKQQGLCQSEGRDLAYQLLRAGGPPWPLRGYMGALDLKGSLI